MRASANRRSGVVLLFSIAVLALMSLLAVMFTTTSRMERNVSRNYVDDARAKMNAETGLNVAISSLREIAQRRAWDNPNEPWLFPLDPTRNPFVTRPTTCGFAIETARRPSFLGGPPLPSGAPVSGTPAQQVASTYEGGRDYYRLKVIDCASQLNVNLFDIGASPSAKAVLEGMLTNLGRAIQDTVQGARNPVGNQAAAITNYRLTLPGKVYSSEEQLVEALRAVFPTDCEARYHTLRDFVTTRGWVDETQSAAGNYRPATDFPISPSRRLDLVRRGRSPINVNVAPPAVLVSALAGLCGHELGLAPYQAAIMGVAPAQWVKTLATSGGSSSCVTYPIARQVAAAIVDRRTSQGPFRTWGEFESFVDTIPLTPQQRMVVKANANPNLRLNKFNPNEVVFQRIDKVDLGYFPEGTSGAPQKSGTTEFSFSSMGYFEIESLGRVSRFEGGREVVQASKLLFTTVKVFDVVRLTTQKDFVDSLVSASRARSYPESLDEAAFGGSERGDESRGGANRFDGAIAIGTEWDDAARAGQTFYHSFGRSLSSTTPRMAPLENGKHETGAGSSGGNLSVLEGNDLVPDGLLNWRWPGGQEELDFETTPGVVPDGAGALAGSVDLWVKLASDPSRGSDEVLFYAVKEIARGVSVDSAGNPVSSPEQRWGLAWKLERFGTRIRSTRFLYGYPDRERLMPDLRAPGALAPNGAVRLAYTEVDFFCTSWKAHEWHRLTHSWTNGTEQWLDVDGQRAGMTFQLEREKAQDVGAQFDWRPGAVFKRTVNGFRLVTLDPDQRFQVGGYSYTYRNPDRAANRVRVYNQQWQILEGQTLERYPNATIDEVRIATRPASSGARDRYATQGSSWRGRIPYTALGGGRLGTVSYTVYYPKVLGSRSLTPGQLRIGFQAGFSSKGLERSPSPASGAVHDGEGWGVYASADSAIPTGEDLRFEIEFRNPGGITPLTVTPVVDDITVTVMGEVRHLEYSWVLRPDPQP
ncbi:MAG: pilus assembly PilX N-terminal domain-containing protein [Planctomycetota bacterium]